jgi:HlyD family secretion protein
MTMTATTAAKKKTGRKAIVWSVLIVVLLGLCAAAYFLKPKALLIVQTEPAARRNLVEVVTATGKVQPVTQVKISSEVSGEIIEVGVKEGQPVKKGDLLVKIFPELYIASRNISDAMYKSSLAGLDTAIAQEVKAAAEYKRNKELYDKKLVSDSAFDEANANWVVAKAQSESARHQVENSKAGLKKAEEDLLKCTIYSPLDGTVSQVISEKGERVVGTGMMAGTEMMTVADLGTMEARVDVSEVDVIRVKLGQKVRLEVDSFPDRKFTGTVTRIANTAKTSAAATQQEATKFEVRILIDDKEHFRPGMSVTADIETQYRTNVLSVPIQSVTTRLPKGAEKPVVIKDKEELDAQQDAQAGKRKATGPKAVDVVFVVDGSKAVMKPVKRGISDENYYEIVEGVGENEQVVTGSYKALAKELEDGKLVKVDNHPKAVVAKP